MWIRSQDGTRLCACTTLEIIGSGDKWSIFNGTYSLACYKTKEQAISVLSAIERCVLKPMVFDMPDQSNVEDVHTW